MSIIIYTSAYCPYCIQAKRLLDHKQVSYEEISVDGQPALRQEMTQKSGRTTVPQIFNGETHVGDCMEIFGFESDGSLDKRLGISA